MRLTKNKYFKSPAAQKWRDRNYLLDCPLCEYALNSDGCGDCPLYEQYDKGCVHLGFNGRPARRQRFLKFVRELT